MRITPITTEEQASGNGRGTARGISGTGWMTALDSIVEEAIAECGIQSWPSSDITHEQLVDRLRRYAEGWTETNQFCYEVWELFATRATGESRIYRLMELQDAWIDGYIEVLLKKVVAKLPS